MKLFNLNLILKNRKLQENWHHTTATAYTINTGFSMVTVCVSLQSLCSTARGSSTLHLQSVGQCFIYKYLQLKYSTDLREEINCVGRRGGWLLCYHRPGAGRRDYMPSQSGRNILQAHLRFCTELNADPQDRHSCLPKGMQPVSIFTLVKSCVEVV